MNINRITCAAALCISVSANAGITKMDGGEFVGYGDSTVLLVMLDSTGAQTRGLTIDLGFNYSDFALPYTSSLGPVPGTGTLSAPGVTVDWDFSANTITLNGSVMSGMTNDWSSQVEDFLTNAQLNETKFALVAGSTRGVSPGAFLATGTPTAAQLSLQNAGATAAFSLVAPLFTNNNTRGTHASADNGAYSMAATDLGYVGTDYASNTTVGGWRNYLKWSGWTAVGGRTNLYQILSNGQERALGDLHMSGPTILLNDMGTLSLSSDARMLTWSTYTPLSLPIEPTPLPEPESYALGLLGLMACGAVSRRKKA